MGEVTDQSHNVGLASYRLTRIISLYTVKMQNHIYFTVTGARDLRYCVL